MNNGKVQKLLTMLARSYYEKRWIPMEEIIRYTVMSSFNQRIQTMREHDIDVRNKMESKKSYYRMFTDPMSFNWEDHTAQQPHERIKRPDKKIEPVSQGSLGI